MSGSGRIKNEIVFFLVNVIRVMTESQYLVIEMAMPLLSCPVEPMIRKLKDLARDFGCFQHKRCLILQYE